MYSLRKRRSSSIRLGFTKGLPKGLSDKDKEEIEKQFRMADFSRKDEFILAYTRMAVAIGTQYKQNNGSCEDTVSVALVTLCGLPKKISEGDRQTDSTYSLDNYVAYRIRNECLSFVRRDHVLYIALTTMRRHNLPALNQVERLIDFRVTRCVDREDDYMNALGITPIFDTLAAPEAYPEHLPDDITSKAETAGQLKIMELIGQGYTNVEIAAKLLKSEGWVRKQLLRIKEILNESLHALDTVNSHG